VLNHSIEITGLAPSTTYEYQVTSKDAGGRSATWAPTPLPTFMTLAPPTTTETGLTGYWNLDAVNNNQITDLSGTGNTGTLVNGVTLSTDHPTVNFSNTGSLNFDGVGGYVAINPIANDLTQDFTIAIWIKANNNHVAASGKEGVVIGTNTSAGGNVFRLTVGDGSTSSRDNRINVYDGRSGAYEITGSVVGDNTWHHVAYTRSGSSGSLYVDGVLQGTHTANYTFSSTHKWSIGQEWDSATPSDFLKGLVDELRIYNRVLSAAQIQNLAQGNLPDYTKPTISDVSTTNITSSGATINWTTDEPTDAVIDYGTTTSYGYTVSDSTLRTGHFHGISDLQSATKYYYKITSKDAVENEKVYESDFTTAQATTAPERRAVEATRFIDLTQGAAKLELSFNPQDFGGNPAEWSYAIDGGSFSARQAYDGAPKIISIPEGFGRRLIQVKFYSSTNQESQVYQEEFNLEAMRAVVAFDPTAATKSIADLIREGLFRTDKWGNLLTLYDRDPLVQETNFTGTRIDAPAHGATLPSITAEFTVQNGASLLLETGFVISGEFVRGKPARGTAQLVIEDGFLKLKVKVPREEIVDQVSFLVDREEVFISKHNLEIGKRYALQFSATKMADPSSGGDFTEGLEIYLDLDHRGIVSEPMFSLAGVQADPYLNVNALNTQIESIQIYGNTRKVLTANNEVHEFTYTYDGGGKLAEVRDQVRWSRFENSSLSAVTYDLRETFDAQGRLLTLVDRNGETIRWTYDVGGRLTKREELANGRTLDITYQDNSDQSFSMTETLRFTDGFLNSVTRVTKEDFDPQVRRTKFENPGERVITYSYSQTSSEVTASISEGSLNYSVVFKPDSRGRAIRTVDRTGAQEVRTYIPRLDGSEEILIQRTIPGKDKNGNDVTYQTTGRIIKDREGRTLEAEDIQGRIARSTYDAQGDITGFDDGWGRVTNWVYVKNLLGVILRATQTLGFTDDFGNPIQAVSGREYDPLGNMIAELNPDGKGRVFVYDFYAYNRKLKSLTAYFYKGVSTLDQLLATHQSSPSAVTSRREWDETGELTLDRSPRSEELRSVVSRDLKGNITRKALSMAYTDGGVQVARTEAQDYDVRGNLIKSVGPFGHETTFVYDNFRNLLSSTKRLAGDASGEFNRVSSFKETRNSAGLLLSRERTESDQDGYGNLVQEKSFEEYDQFGNLTHVVHPNGEGEVIVYQYRTDGRIQIRTTYRYQGVVSLADLKLKHQTPSALQEKVTFGLLGEILRHETFDEKTIDYQIDRDVLGLMRIRTTLTTWTTEDGRIVTTSSTEEWNQDGNLTRELLPNGEEFLHTYGALGSRTRTVRRIPFNSVIHESTVDFSEARQSSGVLVTQSETVTGHDSFSNQFSFVAIREFNEFGEEIASIDEQGKGRITEYSRFAWDEIEEARVYEYEGVNNLASLRQLHQSTPKLIDRTKYNFLGEVIETQNSATKLADPSSGGKDVLVTQYLRLKRANGALARETRTALIPNAASQVSVDEFDSEGRLIRSTNHEGILTTYNYARNGDLLSQVETSTGSHLVTTTHSLTRFVNGVNRTVSRISVGVDRFGRLVDLQTVQEFDSRGELIYSIDELERGQVLIRERDSRDRVRKLVTYQLEDGEGFLNYAKANLGASQTLQHLTLDLVKQWYLLLPSNSTIASQFAPQTKTQELDSLGNEIVTETKGERLEKSIVTNSIGRPSEIKNLTYFSFGEKGPIVKTQIEAKAFVPPEVGPKVTVSGNQIDLSALTGAGVATVILEAGDPARVVTRIYSSAQLAQLAADLNSRQNGDLLILVTRGDIGKNFDEALFQAVEAFGSAKVRGIAPGGAFSFIGVKGGTRGQAIEDYREKPGETSGATNFRSTREVFDLRGYLLRYEDGFSAQQNGGSASLGGGGSVMNYTRGFDGEALTLVETREEGAWEKSYTYQKLRDSSGRLSSTTEFISERNLQGFENPVGFQRDWEITGTGHSIQGGKLTIDPQSGRQTSSIFSQATDDHEMSGDLSLVDTQEADLFILLRYVSGSHYLGLRLMKDKLELVLRDNGIDNVLQTVMLATLLAINTTYSFSAVLEGRRVTFSLGGNQLLDWMIPDTTLIPEAGALALGVESGKASFDNLTAIRRLVKGRSFGASEILSKRTDQAGVSTYFNLDGDIIKIEDPANGIVKIYELEKYGNGVLKRKKETVSVTARNVDGQNVTTTVAMESHYDVQGRLIKFIDSKGGVTDYTYTSQGETNVVTFPDGKKIEYAYTSNTQTGDRTTRESHSQARRNALGEFLKDGNGIILYDLESEVRKIHNKDGDLVFLSEYLVSDGVREEVEFTYEYYSGVERKLKRKQATHSFIEVSTGNELLTYLTFEERDQDGLITKSKDDQGVEKEYQYRELTIPGEEKNLKRIRIFNILWGKRRQT
ncbi:MAG: hypothetical protein HY584_03720, partial [Candidatus Omnitrophica bacterium]|nr:hypothetical protein [Candidatus Omnitrophota bacterium]